MDAMEIAIYPPVTARCDACGWRRVDSTSYPAKCPDCGSDKVRFVHSESMNFSRADVRWGQFNLCSSKKDPCYTFYLRKDAPPDLKRQYVIASDYFVDIEDMSALDAAIELKRIIDRYAYNSDKACIAALVEYLTACEERDRRDAAAYKVAHLKRELWFAMKELASLED